MASSLPITWLPHSQAQNVKPRPKHGTNHSESTIDFGPKLITQNAPVRRRSIDYACLRFLEPKPQAKIVGFGGFGPLPSHSLQRVLQAKPSLRKSAQMVLSNRRLKQKLRETLAQSLVESVAKTVPKTDGSENPDRSSKPQSLKVLLDSATQKPRLSKREKRRKLLALRGSEAVSGSGTGSNFEENKGEEEEREVGSEDLGDEEKKKRKREEEEENGALSSEENEVVKEEAKKPKKKKKEKKKKKKKKKRKKDAKNEDEKKEAKNEEEKKDGDLWSGEQTVKETNNNSDRQANGDVPTKVYVGGIPYYSTEDDIRSYFESCGTVTEVDCLRFPDSGKFRGIAIISFKTEAAAKRALTLDGAEMGELFLKIQPYKATRAYKVSDFAPQIVEGYNRIYVGNLSWDITEGDLKKLFSECKISSIHFGMDKETGEFRGYAHVNFSDSLSLTLALKLDQKVVCGRPVKISCAVPLKRAGTPSKSAPTASSTHSISVAPTTGSNSIPVATATDTEADNTELSTVSGKIKRRTCYQCGKKGHLLSACPMAATTFSSTHSFAVTTTTSANSTPVATTTDGGADDVGLSTVSGKIKRRTCYQCGEKGHLSSACPTSATTFSSTHSISIATTTSTDSIPLATGSNSIPVATTTSTNSIPVATTTGADNGGLSAVSGKIKRRTCYECGEKGHISSACPKKQSADNNASM